MRNEKKILEFVSTQNADSQIDRSAGVIRNVKILGLTSRNHRVYPEATLREAIPLYENARVNLNHPDGNPAESRKYQDRFGLIKNVRLLSGEGLFGDFHFNPKHALAEQLLWDAENSPENVGFSHNVQAILKNQDGEQVVEKIVLVRSVDLVADPATTSGLFESYNGTEPEKKSDATKEGDNFSGCQKRSTRSEKESSSHTSMAFSRLDRDSKPIAPSTNPIEIEPSKENRLTVESRQNDAQSNRDERKTSNYLEKSDKDSNPSNYGNTSRINETINFDNDKTDPIDGDNPPITGNSNPTESLEDKGSFPSKKDDLENAPLPKSSDGNSPLPLKEQTDRPKIPENREAPSSIDEPKSHSELLEYLLTRMIEEGSVPLKERSISWNRHFIKMILEIKDPELAKRLISERRDLIDRLTQESNLTETCEDGPIQSASGMRETDEESVHTTEDFVRQIKR